MTDEREGRFIILQLDTPPKSIVADAVSEEQATEKAKKLCEEQDGTYAIYQRVGTVELVRKAEFTRAK